MKFNTILLSALTIPFLMSNLQAAPVQTTEEMRHELRSQLLAFAVRAASRSENSRLKAELSSFLPEGTTELKELRTLTPEQIEHVLQSLSIETREMVCNELSLRLMGTAEEPFKTPADAGNISQLDTFFLLVLELIGHDTHYQPLTRALHTCFGVGSALKIKARLNHDSINAVIPKSFQDQFFTNNPVRIIMMTNRIQTLANTYKK